MRGYLIFGAMLSLAACATPQEQCISAAGKDLRTVEALIATARGNLSRGFAVETRDRLVNVEQVCGVDAEGKDIMCDMAVSEEERVAVAIDFEAEERKLNSLLARRDELLASRNRAIQACLAQYPE